MSDAYQNVVNVNFAVKVLTTGCQRKNVNCTIIINVLQSSHFLLYLQDDGIAGCILDYSTSTYCQSFVTLSSPTPPL